MSNVQESGVHMLYDRQIYFIIIRLTITGPRGRKERGGLARGKGESGWRTCWGRWYEYSAGVRVSVESTTAQPAVSKLPPPLPPPPRRPAPPDFGFQINGSFFFPRLDSTLTYQSTSSPLRPPSCTFETSIFRSRHPLFFFSLFLVSTLAPLLHAIRSECTVHFAILNAARHLARPR